MSHTLHVCVLGARDEENKEVVRTATDGLMFQADEKETLKKEGKGS